MEFIMNTKFLPVLFGFLTVIVPLRAGLITAVPGPNDQGTMIMPMVTITATSGPNSDPTAGAINISFLPPYAPTLKSLNEWSPGDWFADTAAWRSDISPIDGSVFGMPTANSGNGDLFNNEYGFMFMAMPMMGMANIPGGNSLAIRLDSISSTDLKSFNYGNAANRWDQVFNGVDSQVLWTGDMWHNYFTMPDSTLVGTYTAVFEVFISTTPFSGSTGYAQYDATALSAGRNTDFTSAFVTYDFTVIPEPSSFALLSLGLGAWVCLRRKTQGSIS